MNKSEKKLEDVMKHTVKYGNCEETWKIEPSKNPNKMELSLKGA